MFILRVITFFLEYYFIKGYFKKLNDGNNSVFVSQEKHFTLKRITKLSTDNIAHLKITQKRRDNVFSSLRQIESSFDLIATWIFKGTHKCIEKWNLSYLSKLMPRVIHTMQELHTFHFFCYLNNRIIQLFKNPWSALLCVV